MPHVSANSLNRIDTYQQHKTQPASESATMVPGDMLYHMLAGNALDLISRHRLDGTIVYASPAVEHILGYTGEALVGSDGFGMLIHPDDLLQVRRLVKDLKADPQLQVCAEMRLKHLGGHYVWVEVTSRVLADPESDTWEIVSISRDISARKKAEAALLDSEARYRQLVETMNDGLVSLDSEFIVTFANRRLGEMLQYSAEEMVGRPVSEFVHQEYKDLFRAQMDSRRGGRNTSYEIAWTAKNGKKVFTLVSPRAIFDDGGEFIGSTGVFTDITDRKIMEAQLQQAQKMEAVGTLAGGVAHDFNNLLQAIQGYTDLLVLKNKGSLSAIEAVEAIAQATQRGQDLTSQLLTFSRKIESKLQPFNLNVQLPRIQGLLSRVIPKMVTIELDMDSQSCTVNGDTAQLQQILLNLSVNANDAMPQGGRIGIESRRITVSASDNRASSGMRPGEYVRLTVSDTGTGMHERVRERIFEPFFTTKGIGKGTGLGLSMVYGIVKNHGGYIDCQSQPGSGTSFEIFLPALPEACELDANVQPQLPGGGTEAILLVDDEAELRKTGQEMLSEFGYRVLVANNACAAMDLYRQQGDRINLVILDLIMPGMSGAECLRELLAVNPDVRVLIASGYSPGGSTQDALISGAKGFLNKPYSLRELLGTVRTVLDDK